MSNPQLDRVLTLGEAHKHALIRDLLPTGSLLDAGGMWGVHGAYALRATVAGVPRVVVADSLRTPEFDAATAELPQVDFRKGDLSSKEFLMSFPRVETSMCMEVLFHQPIPQLLLYGLTACTEKTIFLSLSVLPEDRFSTPNGALFLPGMPADHHDALHPAPDDPTFQVFSKDPPTARTHAEWHWGLSSSIVTSWMGYLGWGCAAEDRASRERGWDWWWGRFEPAPDLRFP